MLGVANGLGIGDVKERLQWWYGQLLDGMGVYVSLSFLGTNSSLTREMPLTLATKP